MADLGRGGVGVGDVLGLVAVRGAVAEGAGAVGAMGGVGGGDGSELGKCADT